MLLEKRVWTDEAVIIGGGLEESAFGIRLIWLLCKWLDWFFRGSTVYHRKIAWLAWSRPNKSRH